MGRQRMLTLRDLSGAQTQRVAEIMEDAMHRLIGLRSRAGVEALAKIGPIIKRELKRASRGAL